MEKADIAIMTETKGQPPAIEGFTWTAKNRNIGKGGGIAIGTRNNMGFQITQKEMEGSDQLETLWIEIKGSREQVVNLGCFYGPQENKRKEEVEEVYEQLKDQVANINPENPVILVGDFNAKILVKHEDKTIQQESRNGKIMLDFLEETGLLPLNESASMGTWTRVNRKNPAERSIIDYITANGEGIKRTCEIEIDEVGSKRLKSMDTESDHNTITFKIKMENNSEKRKVKKWKIKEDSDWEEFNKELTKNMRSKDRTYENLQKALNEAMKKTIGQITITTSTKRRKECKEVKESREKKKRKKNEMQNAQMEEKRTKLQKYYKAQQELRETIVKSERQNTERTLELIAKEPNMIWEIRKKLLGKRKEEPDTITEEGQVLKDPEEAKEYIAKYYEELYQAREDSEEGKEWTKRILESNKRIEERLQKQENIPPIRQEEMERTKRRLKKRKSSGPDNIPNEPLKYANPHNTRIIQECMNNIIKDGNIPVEWKKGRIISIYKGKGKRGKCSSERGITIGSNVGKFFERIINERANKLVRISEYQGGGKKGSSTVDHLTTLHEVIRIGKKVHITFLDVTKAYDKAWADGIMYVMEKEGIKDATWKIIRKLNENLKAQVETKHGTTREITMKDNIRQGGVLSVMMYAVLMDEIAKEIERKELGVEITPGKKIGCLLWMDDVVLISEDSGEMQEMLNITHQAAVRFRLKFGSEKSKTMRIGKHQGTETNNLKLGEMELEECKKYKYLGVIISEKGNMEEHIEETRRKIQGAYNTMMSIAGSVNLKGIEMRTIWKIVRASIIPIITYGWEARNPTKKEEAKLMTILNKILKRILMIPKGTPNEPVYLETGLMEVDLTLKQQRTNYLEKIRNKENSILQALQKAQGTKGWWKKTEETKQEMVDDTWDDQEEIFKKKRRINEATKAKMLERTSIEGVKKTKTRFYLENKKNMEIGKCALYMEKCTRIEASTIIAARTRMIDVKGNYKNKYKETKCRWCKIVDETQEHFLEECTEVDRTNIGKIGIEELFEECPNKLKETAKKIMKLKDLNMK